MPRPRPLALAAAGLLLFALACGGGETRLLDEVSASADVISRKVYGPATITAHALEEDPTVLLVPPDRALLRIEGWTRRGSPQAAAEALRQLQAQVQAVGPACTVELLDLGAPSPVGDELWQADLLARASVDLREAKTLEARAEAVDACVLALEPLRTTADGREDKGLGRTGLLLSAPLLSVDRPEAHIPALLAAEAARLQAVGPAEAPQLHPEDLRCTALPGVRVGERRLSGVALSLAMDCKVERPSASPAP